MKRTWEPWSLLLLLLVVAGCVSHSGQFDPSPCAGCDFQPVSSVQSAG